MNKQIQKPKMGRPIAMTDRVLEKLESSLCAGYSVTTACYFAGVSTSTYYEYKALDKEFSDKVTRASEWATFRARQVILQEIEKGNLKAAMYWLERKSRAEFAPPKPM